MAFYFSFSFLFLDKIITQNMKKRIGMIPNELNIYLYDVFANPPVGDNRVIHPDLQA